jgi:Uma2 family endonuclease
VHATVPEPFPETKPATEFIDGQLVQKMSPRGLHARVQAALARMLIDWAETRRAGRVGTEWDFDLTPPGGSVHRLVPDVAFLSYARVPYDDDDAAEIPTVAPELVIEVLSPGQSMADLARKIDIYRTAGVELIVVVDPRAQRAVLHGATGHATIRGGGTIEHPALPGLRLPLERAFAKGPRPE